MLFAINIGMEYVKFRHFTFYRINFKGDWTELTIAGELSHWVGVMELNKPIHISLI